MTIEVDKIFLIDTKLNNFFCRQDKTRQDKTRQDKTRQDKTRQDKTRQDKTRQDKTRQDKTRQDKTRQDKTRQDKTRQDKTRQDKTRQDKTRQDKTRQDKTRQDKTRQDKTRQDKTQERWVQHNQSSGATGVSEGAMTLEKATVNLLSSSAVGMLLFLPFPLVCAVSVLHILCLVAQVVQSVEKHTLGTRFCHIMFLFGL